MVENKILVMVAVLLASVVGAGCISASDSMENETDREPCGFYPDREYLNKAWGQYMNHSREGFDVVKVGVSRWGNLETGTSPERYIDWNNVTKAERPPLFEDALCYALWRIENIDTLAERFSSTIGTSNIVAVEALNHLQRVHVDQTGHDGWDDGEGYSCCYIVFEGHVFGSGCHGAHATYENGGASSHCTWRP